MIIFSKYLFLFFIGAFNIITQVLAGCKDKCVSGDCDGDVCKIVCGGLSFSTNTCPKGYICYGDDVPVDGRGFCEKLECGGIFKRSCKPGYWCDIIDQKSAGGLGVCTNKRCPSECTVWYDGCNTCQCSHNQQECTKKTCSYMGRPYCIKLVASSQIKYMDIGSLIHPTREGFALLFISMLLMMIKINFLKIKQIIKSLGEKKFRYRQSQATQIRSCSLRS